MLSPPPSRGPTSTGITGSRVPGRATVVFAKKERAVVLVGNDHDRA
jgi:hypothetical protein